MKGISQRLTRHHLETGDVWHSAREAAFDLVLGRDMNPWNTMFSPFNVKQGLLTKTSREGTVCRVSKGGRERGEGKVEC